MILYLETSRLVKLYVEEAESEKTAKLVEAAEFSATSIVSYVEARAAFSRKLGDGGLTESEYRAAKAGLDEDWDRFIVLHAAMDIIREAGRLAEKYGLRAFDALHLASALSLDSREDERISILFASADSKLNKAARLESLKIG
jgi:predicted nucleic acid-binding protein